MTSIRNFGQKVLAEDDLKYGTQKIAPAIKD